MVNQIRKVLVQMAHEIPDGSGGSHTNNIQNCFPIYITNKIPESSDVNA